MSRFPNNSFRTETKRKVEFIENEEFSKSVKIDISQDGRTEGIEENPDVGFDGFVRRISNILDKNENSESEDSKNVEVLKVEEFDGDDKDDPENK